MKTSYLVVFKKYVPLLINEIEHNFINWCHLSFYLIYFIFNFTVLYWFCHISTWICHRYTRVPHREPSSLLPPCTIPLGHPSAPAPSIQYRASNLDWQLVSYMILYMFQCIHPNQPTLSLSHRVQKNVLYISVSFAVSYTGLLWPFFKVHIYALVYCIGVFLSGLLHSV